MDSSRELPGTFEGPVSPTGPSSFSRRRLPRGGIALFFAFLLVLEGLSAGLTAVQRAPTIGAYSWPMTLVYGARILVGILQFASGFLIIRRSALGPGLGQVAIFASAVIVTLEFGANLAPHNLFPTYIWPVVVGYWIYAVAAAVGIGGGRR